MFFFDLPNEETKTMAAKAKLIHGEDAEEGFMSLQITCLTGTIFKQLSGTIHYGPHLTDHHLSVQLRPLKLNHSN